MPSRFLLSAAVATLVACSSGIASQPTDGNPGAPSPSGAAGSASPTDPASGEDIGPKGEGGASSSSSSGASAPSFTVTATTSSARITEGSRFTVTATVDDGADGFTIAGGELSDDASGKSLGKFSEKTHGKFELQLAWSDLGAAQAINFAGTGPVRKLTATFYNQSGKKVAASVSETLYCASTTACNSRCTDLSDGVACGACGKSCPTGYACKGGGICQLTTGTPYYTDTSKSCAQYCALESGGTCLSGTETHITGATTPVGCAQAGNTPLTAMVNVSYAAGEVYCGCRDNEAHWVDKDKLPGKSCAISCNPFTNHLNCYTTVVNIPRSSTHIEATCVAPYTGVGNLDPIDGTTAGTISVPDRVSSRTCLCQTSAK